MPRLNAAHSGTEIKLIFAVKPPNQPQHGELLVAIVSTTGSWDTCPERAQSGLSQSKYIILSCYPLIGDFLSVLSAVQEQTCLLWYPLPPEPLAGGQIRAVCC